MRILILEDNSDRIRRMKTVFPNATYVNNVHDTIEYLRAENWDLLAIDHDLNGEAFVDSGREDCGMEVVRWLMKEGKPIDNILLHSGNAKASKIMQEILIKLGYNAVRFPFDGEFTKEN